MINEGDKIAIGVSGGKDSLTLLLALKNLQRYFPKKFDIVALTLGMGKPNADYTPIATLCQEQNIEFHYEETLIGRIVFDERKEKNPCSLCANLRRGAMNNLAVRLGCNKVALGHHNDDVLETLLMSMFYEGRIHTFPPITYLQRKNIHIIRPMIYVYEKDIKAFAKENNLPIVKGVCEHDGKSTRQSIKELLYNLNRQNKEVKRNLFGAIKRSDIEVWKP